MADIKCCPKCGADITFLSRAYKCIWRCRNCGNQWDSSPEHFTIKKPNLISAGAISFTVTFLLGYLYNLITGSHALNGLLIRPLSVDFLVGISCGVAAGQVFQVLLRKPKKDTV